MLDPSSNSLNFKPLKKYQLDFSVSSLLSLTHSLFVLSSSSDNKIHLFDRESKKATVYDAHELSANILEKLDSPRADSYVRKYCNINSLLLVQVKMEVSSSGRLTANPSLR